ncbi:MAG: helix-turn-helix domain-containing protein, partial [Bacillota bacterium]|nr:helix-turn-helix domain-containing protein [Bacillota bacterium]
MFIEIQQLKQSGFNKSQVARHLNLNWKTVDKYW